MNIDIETYSSNDISKCGVYKYTEAEDFEILIIAYSIDGGPVSAIDMTKVDNEPYHADYETFKIALFDPAVKKYAFNANFERTCLAKHFNKSMPPEEWICTMVNSMRIGLPASLDKVGEVLRLQNQKDKAGKNLIRYFSMPCKPTKVNGGRTRNLPEHDPEKWQQFIDYCIRDVEVEMAIANKIKDFPVTTIEQKYWVFDQHINDRGIKLSKSLMLGANVLDKQSKEELLKQAKQITDLENPNSPTQLLTWLNKEQGLDIPNLQKKTVKDYLKEATGKAKKMLEIRLQMSKTSVKKYNKMHDMMCSDERVRGLFQFYGAGTGRWAGRGVQLQNLTKHYISDTELEIARDLIKEQRFDDLDLLLNVHPQDLLSQLVRTTFTAEEGNELAVSDFSAIEARVIAWYAKEQWRLDVFNTHGKIYEASASQMFNVPVESITKGDPLRQKGKVSELACIAEGQKVLTNHGLVAIEKVKKDMLVFDGVSFVKHDGVIYKGIKEVMSYEGLKATRDHLVFVEGADRAVQFEESARAGLRLCRPQNTRASLRLGKNNKFRKKIPNWLERSDGSCGMHLVQKDILGPLLQHKEWEIQRMPKVLSSKKSSSVVVQEVVSSKAALREPKRQKLQKLWRAWNSIQIQICLRRCFIYDESNRNLRERFGNRSNRRKRSLRKREYEVGYTSAKLSKPAKVYDILNAGPNNRYVVEGVLVHNCGYQGGVGALKAMGALDMGLKESELQGLIDNWRKANPNIVNFWKACQEAAINTVKSRKTHHTHGLRFYMKKGFLMIELPSGRALAYPKASVGENSWGSQVVEFMGLDLNRKWSKLKTYGGKLVENIVQATARDLLAISIARLEASGFKIVGHVHDEVIVEIPRGSNGLKEIETIMNKPVEWAEGLNLNSDGFTSPFYMKD